MYRMWRECVFKRDDYRCKKCCQRGGQLNADHILPFAHYPLFRYDVTNGRTLCVPCHKLTDTFGSKANFTGKKAKNLTRKGVMIE